MTHICVSKFGHHWFSYWLVAFAVPMKNSFSRNGFGNVVLKMTAIFPQPHCELYILVGEHKDMQVAAVWHGLQRAGTINSTLLELSSIKFAWPSSDRGYPERYVHGFVMLCLFVVVFWIHMVYFMMTSSNGNISRVIGHFCGEFTGYRWIPRTKASDAELWCFLWSAPEWTVE